MNKEKEALDLLLNNKNIQDSFFRYWNDAVNSTGYSSKLLLMFSALEALIGKEGKDTKDFDLLEKILGEDLKKELWGEKGESRHALRHRLVHGEYFDFSDNKKNYVQEIHTKVIHYFNKHIFKKELLSQDVINPQRHFFGNKLLSKTFIKNVQAKNVFDLKSVLIDFNANGINATKSFRQVLDDNLNETY